MGWFCKDAVEELGKQYERKNQDDEIKELKSRVRNLEENEDAMFRRYIALEEFLSVEWHCPSSKPIYRNKE